MGKPPRHGGPDGSEILLPFLSSTPSFAFFVLLIDQRLERRRPYQLVWALGMLWYALSAGTEWIGGAVGWSEPLYKTWTAQIWSAGSVADSTRRVVQPD